MDTEKIVVDGWRPDPSDPRPPHRQIGIPQEYGPETEKESSDKSTRRSASASTILEHKSTDDVFNAKSINTTGPNPSSRRVLEGLLRMVTVTPGTDPTWQVAIGFTIGSIIWIITSFFSFLPYAGYPEFPGQTSQVSGILACAGSAVFFITSLIVILEAINVNLADCKKWKTEQFWDEESQEHRLETVPDLPALPSGGRDYRSRKNSRVHIPSYRDFREHYIYKLSFWACCIQTVSSCLFLWGGICAVPQIYNVISTSRILLNTLYWLPKLLACIGFISAGVLNTLERQNEWSKPAWNALGWHIGTWKVIGAVGFLLMACFGFGTSSWMKYQSALSALWGSWAFLLASLLYWYKSVGKYPVKILKLDNRK